MYSQQHYQGPNVVPIRQRRYRATNKVLPSIFSGILGTIQLFLWIAIIILEAVSIYYDAGRGTIFAGLWCSIVFFVTWVSMFCYLCCGKTRGCGSYLVVQNTINLVFAIILVIFTTFFVQDPCLCYGAFCRIPNWDFVDDTDYNLSYVYSCTLRTRRKVPVLKGLLACAVLMLVCNIVFIVTYLIVSIRLRWKARSKGQTPDVVYQQQSPAFQWQEQPSYPPSNMAYSPHQYHPSYPIRNTQRTSQWTSAPPSYEMRSEKF